jgi:hypothetical protein
VSHPKIAMQRNEKPQPELGVGQGKAGVNRKTLRLCDQQIGRVAVFSRSARMRCHLEVILSRCCKRERGGGKALVCGEPLKLLGND